MPKANAWKQALLETLHHVMEVVAIPQQVTAGSCQLSSARLSTVRFIMETAALAPTTLTAVIAVIIRSAWR